ncbi:MAG: glycoside hydrolase family 2 [Lachnospiraceae bacterium]|nr:glycoside hydrolase family 2 [Lachnospiraceae bacterium]
MNKKNSDGRNIRQLRMEDEVGEIPFREYPRPQLYRDSAWKSLNGKWDCGVTVPFPLESVLSGFSELPEYDGSVPEEYDYHTTFVYNYSGRLGADKDGCRVLLHFGAVDQLCDVSIDGVNIGHHEGGYLPFAFDVTDALKAGGEHKLKVHATDRLDIRFPYGKQSKKPGGMWYTPVSGIWQTVWLEEVPGEYIRGLRITPSLDGISLEVDGDADKYTVEVFEPVQGRNPASLISAPYDMTEPSRTPEDEAQDRKPGIIYSDMIYGKKKIITVKEPLNWTPATPYLYGIRVSSDTDSVSSYFALRTVGIEKRGRHRRILLNGKPIFFHGVLDQGYYPEGIFLPDNEKGYTKDIRSIKALGFNTLRKHIKTEPPAFYVACDVQGMLVWQDMVNNSDYSYIRDTLLPNLGIKAKTDLFSHRDPESRRIFVKHMRDTVRYLYNFPCICFYTIFNEGWGQFESDRLYLKLKALDPTRIVDSASGWFRQFKSDVISRHVYFRRITKKGGRRPVVISEFGGYSLAVKGHVFNPAKSYGYKSFDDRKTLGSAIVRLYREQIIPCIAHGCCGCIYTQLSDVEDETNGLFTYDRKVCKADGRRMRQVAEELYSELERCTSRRDGRY